MTTQSTSLLTRTVHVPLWLQAFVAVNFVLILIEAIASFTWWDLLYVAGGIAVWSLVLWAIRRRNPSFALVSSPEEPSAMGSPSRREAIAEGLRRAKFSAWYVAILVVVSVMQTLEVIGWILF